MKRLKRLSMNVETFETFHVWSFSQRLKKIVFFKCLATLSTLVLKVCFGVWWLSMCVSPDLVRNDINHSSCRSDLPECIQGLYNIGSGNQDVVDGLLIGDNNLMVITSEFGLGVVCYTDDVIFQSQQQNVLWNELWICF